MASSSDRRPVVALDVDGVLNPSSDQPGFELFEVTVMEGSLPDSPFVNPLVVPGTVLSVRLSKVHAEWITSLREVAEVVWATTWEHAANELLAPLLGIEPLGVIEHSTVPPTFSQWRNGEVASWKFESIDAHVGDRPLVWVDDQAWGFTQWNDPDPPARSRFLVDVDEGDEGDEVGRPYSKAPSLVVVPDERVGLTDADRSRIDEFVASHQPD
jgi:hypothetical protein